MNKICFTAIIGEYEDLKTPTFITPGWEYICFTDQPLHSDVWRIVPVTVGDRGATRTARRIKIMAHEYLPENSGYLWLDASFQINCNLDHLWQYFKAPLTAPRHPIRNCVYAEVRSCLSNKRGDAVEVQKQWDEYKPTVTMFANNIISSGILMRDSSSIAFCEDWWKEVEAHSTRDQIAFAKVSQGRPGEWNMFKWDYSQSKEIKYVRHYHLRNTNAGRL